MAKHKAKPFLLVYCRPKAADLHRIDQAFVEKVGKVMGLKLWLCWCEIMAAGITTMVFLSYYNGYGSEMCSGGEGGGRHVTTRENLQVSIKKI